METKRTITLSEQDYTSLAQIAQEQGTTVEALVLGLIKEKLARQAEPTSMFEDGIPSPNFDLLPRIV